MYQIRILEAALRELARLDAVIARRAIQRMNWLAENLDVIRPEALSADLAGLYKLRTGDYRIIYEVLREEGIVVIHSVGHRREIYRRR